MSDFLKNSSNVGGLIFQMGKLTQKVDNIVPQVHALETQQLNNGTTLYDIHGKISKLEEKVDNVACAAVSCVRVMAAAGQDYKNKVVKLLPSLLKVPVAVVSCGGYHTVVVRGG